MKLKFAIAVAAALMISAIAQAQAVRANYRIDGRTHIAAAPQQLQFGTIPGKVYTEFVGFPDGGALYLLYISLEHDKNASTAAPKGVKMAVNLTNGKMVRLEQIGMYPASAKETRLKYAIETADMEKMVKGIKSVDIVTGWNPDDYIQASFKTNELGALLKSQCEAIKAASEKTCEVKASLRDRQESQNSIITTTNPLVARGDKMDYNVLLCHLYYKNDGNEDLELYFAIGTNEQFHIPYDSSLRFTLADGSEIGLLQAWDDVNFVRVYPSMDDVARMVDVGVTGITIDCEDGLLQDTFSPREDGEYSFSDVLRHQIQLIYYFNSL